MQNNNDRTYAGFFVRLAAYTVDIILVSLMLLIIKTPLWIVTLASPDNILVKDFIFQYSVMDIILYLLKVTYFILLTYYTGSTLGKKLFRIEVVSSENRPLTFFEVAYRETVGKFLSAVMAVTMLTAITEASVYAEKNVDYSNQLSELKVLMKRKKVFMIY